MCVERVGGGERHKVTLRPFVCLSHPRPLEVYVFTVASVWSRALVGSRRAGEKVYTSIDRTLVDILLVILEANRDHERGRGHLWRWKVSCASGHRISTANNRPTMMGLPPHHPQPSLPPRLLASSRLLANTHRHSHTHPPSHPSLPYAHVSLSLRTSLAPHAPCHHHSTQTHTCSSMELIVP